MVDVELTEKGRRQAATTSYMMSRGSSRINETHRREFMRATNVCSSCLRRPVQTACLAVPLSVRRGKKMILLPSLREYRSDMNSDSVGHTTQELRGAYASCLGLSLPAVEGMFDFANVQDHPGWGRSGEHRGKWWTPDHLLTRWVPKRVLGYVAEEEEVLAQVQQTLEWMKSRDGAVIASSHSHKISEILKRLPKSTYSEQRVKSMKSEHFHNMGRSPPNASVIRLDLAWRNGSDELPVILDADMVYNPEWDADDLGNLDTTFRAHNSTKSPAEHLKPGRTSVSGPRHPKTKPGAKAPSPMAIPKRKGSGRMRAAMIISAVFITLVTAVVGYYACKAPSETDDEVGQP